MELLKDPLAAVFFFLIWLWWSDSAVEVVAQNVVGQNAMSFDPVWTPKANPYIIQGFMKHDRLALYADIITEEATKQLKEW